MFIVLPGAPKQDEPAECDEGELQISREYEHPPQGHCQDAHRLADGPPPEMKYSQSALTEFPSPDLAPFLLLDPVLLSVIVVVAEDVLGQLKIFARP